MTNEVQNDQFRKAVAAIDAGDIETLERLLAANPTLVSERLEVPGDWLRATVGNAVDGFFARPYLLWFVAEDPKRNGTLPPNVVHVIRTIVDAARRLQTDSLQEQLDYTLRLVAWSGVAANCGVQIEMIDALVGLGASPKGEANNALVNGHLAAAEYLISRGATLTFAAALLLERWEDVTRMASETNAGKRQFAFVLAALRGKCEALKRMIAIGVDVSAPSEALYSHATPLHHAVGSGSLEAVQILVRAGANIDAVDTAWQGTPLGWARHYVESGDSKPGAEWREIAAYLASRPRFQARD